MDKIYQLAAQWGVEIAQRAACDSYVYDGKTIALYEKSKKQRPDSNLLHDIAHFVIAPKKRKSKLEFGLGSAPDCTKYDPKPLVSAFVAQQEEELVSVLGIYWERELGLNWRKTYKDHSWTGPYMNGPTEEKEIFDIKADHKFAKMLRKLKKRKII